MSELIQKEQLDFLDKLGACAKFIQHYWLYCTVCQVSKEFYSPEAAKSFIIEHKGHTVDLRYGGNIPNPGWGLSTGWTKAVREIRGKMTKDRR